jgi:ATP-dependent protease ClpP protease subunit
MKLTKLFALLVATALIVGMSGGDVGKSKESVIVLSKSNTLVLSGEVDGPNTADLIKNARELGQAHFSGGKPIYLFLNTPGGSIQVGLELIEALHGLNRPVDTVTLFAASMGFQIAQSLGQRYVLKNGILMSHRAAGEISGSFGGSVPSQMDSRYGLWLSRVKELDEQTVSRTGGKQTLESYQKAYANELWLTGTQSVAAGYADKIVALRCDSSLDGVTTHSVDFLGVTVKFDLDNCPINTSPMNIRVDVPPQEKAKITAKQIKDLEAQFAEQYTTKQHSVIPMYW